MMTGKIEDLRRSENSNRTQMKVSLTVFDIQTLAHLITIAGAVSGKLTEQIVSREAKSELTFAFSNYGGSRDFHNFCKSLGK